MQDFIEHNMSAQAVLAKKNPKSDTIAKMLAEGKTTDDCFELEPGFVGFNLNKIFQLQTWLATKLIVNLDPWSELPLPLTTPELEITEWLNTNIKKKRPPRQQHLMLIGPTKTGKTHLVNILRNYLRVYDCPVQGPFFAPWQDNLYDLIVMEELHAGWTVSDLLRFLDGSPTMLKVHGGLQRKAQNVPIIITTNQYFGRSYKNISPASLEALESRVLMVELNRQVDVFPGIIPKNV